MKEDFERFWDYRSGYWADRFLDEWCVRAMRSKIEPMQKFVGILRRHRDLLLNWFKSQGLSSGIVEGLNNKVKTTLNRRYGFRTERTLEVSFISRTWKTGRTAIRPQILVRRQKRFVELKR